MNTKYLFLGLALAAATSFTACDTDSEELRSESPVFEGTSQVYFPTIKESKEFDPAEGISTYTVTIARRDSIGEVTVPLYVSNNDEDIFNVPTSVTFADKEFTSSFEISFPGGKEGITYSLSLYLDADVVNPYYDQVSTYDFSFVNLAWQNAELPAVWSDGIIMAAFGVDYMPFYVNYQYVKLSDGSSKYRFLNPFASMATDVDRYGVYDGYPYNEAGDFDAEGTYNFVVNVTAKGTATLQHATLGVDWGYGPFEAGQIYGELSSNIDSYPLGTLKGGVLTFPAKSLYLYIPGNGQYPAEETTIYLDTKAYQNDHSVQHIADLEDQFNNADIEWNVVEGAKLTEFQSEAFDNTWEEQSLVAASDMDPNAGDKSEFINLYALPDLYADGYTFAFYLNPEKNTISIPTQPTGLSFAGKKILVRDAGGSYVEDSEIYTVAAKKYTFNVELVTEDENLIGNYTEVYYWSENEKPAPEITKDFFLGDFAMSGISPFNGGTDATDVPITIAEGEDGKFHITGIKYAEDVVAEYNDEAKTLSIDCQTLADYGKYDMTLYTFDENFGIPAEGPIVLSVTDPFKGTLGLDESSVAIGYLLRSEAVGGWVDGYYDLVFNPAVATAVIPTAPAVNVKKGFSAIRHNEKVSVANLKIQGKATRYAFKHNAAVVF